MISGIAAAIADEQIQKRRQVLKDLDVFVLDNSIRESTVGQCRGLAPEKMMKIYDEVKMCGFKYIIVSSFSTLPEVDEVFVKQLAHLGEDFSSLFSFSKIAEAVKDGALVTETIPIALRKMKSLKLKNPIFEVSLFDSDVDWKRKFKVEDMCTLLLKRINWTLENLGKDARIFCNLCDFSIVMKEEPARMSTVVRFLAMLPAEKRPFGLLYEDPTGMFLPEEMGFWTSSIREIMNSFGWRSGKLLVHVHKKWGLADAVQLECLCSGADGVWASVCEEGASMGHACSSVAIMNLVRMGNKHALKKYNCTYLRRAAINITQITRKKPPHPRQAVYGDRFQLNFGGFDGGCVEPEEFDIAEFYEVVAPKRISAATSVSTIKERLIDIFGDNPQFSEDIALVMKTVVYVRTKDEYMSDAGIANLFCLAGGQPTPQMNETMKKIKSNSDRDEKLIKEVRDIWDLHCAQGEKSMTFEGFYYPFILDYSGCPGCSRNPTRRGLESIGLYKCGRVHWSDFSLYLKWALHQYPDLSNVNELLAVCFKKGIIPAIRDANIKKQK